MEPIPDKLVVLTFDDSAKSHFTVARPLLLRLKFGATFFITEGFDFRDNKRDYMTWDEIAQLHRDGFEIGNHTRDHKAATKANLPDLPAQVRGINERCREHGLPVPTSFAYPGNGFDVGALPILRDLGIRFARRGGAPEHPYKEGRGFAYEPGRDHPLLIPSAGDARPAWTLKDFERAVAQARGGRVAVLQFHGVPDTAHDWVNSTKAQFEAYMNYLAEHHYRVIALRDLARYVDPGVVPKDPLAVIAERKARLPAEPPAAGPPLELRIGAEQLRNPFWYEAHGLPGEAKEFWDKGHWERAFRQWAADGYNAVLYWPEPWTETAWPSFLIRHQKFPEARELRRRGQEPRAPRLPRTDLGPRRLQLIEHEKRERKELAKRFGWARR